MCFKSPPQSYDRTWLSNLVPREISTPMLLHEMGRWLEEMRTEGRNWQAPIIPPCSWWRTVSRYGSRDLYGCSSAKQSWSQKAWITTDFNYKYVFMLIIETFFSFFFELLYREPLLYIIGFKSKWIYIVFCEHMIMPHSIELCAWCVWYCRLPYD